MKHLLFYDGQCGLCDHAVQFVLKADKRKEFVFAPLQGETAKCFLKNVPEKVLKADSLILIENFNQPDVRLLIYGKGAFRVLWLLGGCWKAFGWISFLPSWVYNWGYRLVAQYRHYFFSKNSCQFPDPKEKERFLS